MTNEAADPHDIRDSDIVFDCPYCGKSLAIDCRGAGLIVTCPDCSNTVEVPIPDGVELGDFDVPKEEQAVHMIHMREVLAASQNRVREIESDLQDMRQRRESLEHLRTETAMRVEIITREVDVIQRALKRITEVLESAAESVRKSAPPSAPNPTAGV